MRINPRSNQVFLFSLVNDVGCEDTSDEWEMYDESHSLSANCSSRERAVN